MRWRQWWRISVLLALGCFTLSWSVVQIKRQGLMLKGYYGGTGLIGERGKRSLEKYQGTKLVPPEIEDPTWPKVFEYHGIRHVDPSFDPLFRKHPPHSVVRIGGRLEWFWAPKSEHEKVIALLPAESKTQRVRCYGVSLMAWCIKDRWIGLGEGVCWELNEAGKLKPTYATCLLFGATDKMGLGSYTCIRYWIEPDVGQFPATYVPTSIGERVNFWLTSRRAKFQVPAYVPLFAILYPVALLLGHCLWRPLLRAFWLRRR